MVCIFRLDDICPTMNWNKFEIFREIFDRYQIKPLLGVVPNNLDDNLVQDKEDPQFWEYIKILQSEGWGIAQHGYQHIYETNNGGILKLNKFSEFAGLPFHVQKEKIQKGKHIFEEKGIFTNIFMAPAHSYDNNTLRALEEVGFAFVTDGYTRNPYKYGNLRFIPCKHVISRKRNLNGLVTVCVHSNTAPTGSTEMLEEMILEYRKNVQNYMEVVENFDNINTSDFWRSEQYLALLFLKIKRLAKKKLGMTKIK